MAGGEAQVNKKRWDAISSASARNTERFQYRRTLLKLPPAGARPGWHDRDAKISAFCQNDFASTTNLHVTAGVRYDQYHDQQDFVPGWSQRAGLIYALFSQSTFSSLRPAFRDPRFFELSELNSLNVNPAGKIILRMDYEASGELASSVAAFYNSMDDLIVIQKRAESQVQRPHVGTEMAWEGNLGGRHPHRTDNSLQQAKTRQQGRPPDSHMAWSRPKSACGDRDKIFAGLEFAIRQFQHTIHRSSGQHGSRRPTRRILLVVNFTLLRHALVKNLTYPQASNNFAQCKYDETGPPLPPPKPSFHRMA